MCICISQELENEVVHFTDAGEWKHSWHWDRDKMKSWSPITLKGAEQMLADLNCEGSMESEIDSKVRTIQSRYEVAARLRRLIQEAKVREIADAHAEGCDCEFCIAAGYAKKGSTP